MSKQYEVKNVYHISYEKVPYGSKVVIYGAGKVGEFYAKSILSNKHCKLVAIVDLDVSKILYGTEIKICHPDILSALEFDYVLIALEDYKVASEVKNSLITRGIDSSKIIWNGTDDFDINIKGVQEYEKFLERNLRGNKGRCFIFMMPEHGNVGDYAIGYAEEQFLNSYFPEYEIITVTTAEWIYAKTGIINQITYEDIILFNGGGYIGDLWEDTDNYKSIAEAFPDNVKIFFPNTLTYKNIPDKFYQPFVQEMNWFKSQKRLYTMFRDKNSYLKFKNYDTRCMLYPDMVLFSHYKRECIQENSKVLLCFRNDRERTFNQINFLKQKLEEYKYEYDELNINAERYVSQQSGRAYVESVCKKMQEYDCVLTDRLHGMIISVISDVPCVAFDNLTHKVAGVYEWISDMEYVKCISSVNLNNINKDINDVVRAKKEMGEYKPLFGQFEKMAESIYQCIGGE